MSPKIVDLQQLPARVAELRASGKRLVATNGCFDVLHVGHVHYLQAARALGDVLLVGVNGDQSTRELKGSGRPINSERDRAEVLAGLECVDMVTIFPEPRATRFLGLAQPDVYAKGGDYTVDSLNKSEKEVLDRLGAQIAIVPFEAGYSTSGLLKKLGVGE